MFVYFIIGYIVTLMFFLVYLLCKIEKLEEENSKARWEIFRNYRKARASGQKIRALEQKAQDVAQ